MEYIVTADNGHTMENVQQLANEIDESVDTWETDRNAVISGIANAIRTWVDDEGISPDYFGSTEQMGIEYGDEKFDAAVDTINARMKEMADYFEQNKVVPLPRHKRKQAIVDMCAYDLISRFGGAVDTGNLSDSVVPMTRDYGYMFQQLYFSLYTELGFQAEAYRVAAERQKAHDDAGCKHVVDDEGYIGHYVGCVYTDPGLVTGE
jgi:hypothetical protein